MKYYAVIDTNVLVSAYLKRDSIPGKIVELIYYDVVVPILSESILQEYRTVLNRPKFHFSQELVNNIITGIEEYGLIFNPETLKYDKAKLPDPDDWKFYELLIQNRKSEETYLITGNAKHFPNKPFIVTPRQMLEIITKEMEKLKNNNS